MMLMPCFRIGAHDIYTCSQYFAYIRRPAARFLSAFLGGMPVTLEVLLTITGASTSTALEMAAQRSWRPSLSCRCGSSARTMRQSMRTVGHRTKAKRMPMLCYSPCCKYTAHGLVRVTLWMISLALQYASRHVLWPNRCQLFNGQFACDKEGSRLWMTSWLATTLITLCRQAAPSCNFRGRDNGSIPKTKK